jgi:hypothetical protein
MRSVDLFDDFFEVFAIKIMADSPLPKLLTESFLPKGQ